MLRPSPQRRAFALEVPTGCFSDIGLEVKK
jgi:hypothetical protein